MMSSLYRSVLFMFALLLCLALFAEKGNRWVGTWSCAPYAAGTGNTPPSPYLTNNTLRQIVRVSIGGDTLRIKFTNKTCSTPVNLNSVYIAESKGGSEIDPLTNTQLKFGGETAVTMAAKSSVTSDAFAFPLRQNTRVAITIHYGEALSGFDITSHVASRTDSYIVCGDKALASDFRNATVTAHWFHINTIDVIAPDTAACIGVLGNSITDGYGLSGGLQNRWTDIFSQKLLNYNRTNHIGVLNLGIGGTNITGSGATTGLGRYHDDLLSQSGLRWIIIFYGTNDIAGGNTALAITNAYKTIINDAHNMGILVFGATITPFKGSGHYSEAHEIVRNEVNEWIRTTSNFDACIDFDKAIRDAYDTTIMAAEFSNDWLHPNVKGYEFLGNCIDLNLFANIESDETLFANAGFNQSLIDHEGIGIVSVNLNGSRSTSWNSNIVTYVWAEGNKQIARGVLPTIDFTVGTHIVTLTITDEHGKTDSDDVVISINENSGVWLEAECGELGSLWNVISDYGASNDKYVTIKSGYNSVGKAPLDTSGTINLSFKIDEGGSYNMFARILCPSANDDSFWIKMDNSSYIMWNSIGSGFWSWVRFSTSFSLSKGTHTITVGYREDGALLDKIWITKSAANLDGFGSDATNCGLSGKEHLILK